ncbi:hypothetical protein [Halomarina litorea]|uniref:hypothetical protein n=1 Tax=Halomarina litorea TaxID=2961595 RepID=UPI0020C2CBEE|nr:hypothetical protein [Halomarina sp. BCD28]
MPYLEPAAVLRRFSAFALEEVRPAVPEDERFVRGQVGSMASTLRFLAGELDAGEASVERQADAFREALDGAEAILDAHDGTAPGVRDAVEDARAALDADGTTRERETALLESCEGLLATVDDELDGEAARAVRRPLYGFLDARLDAQLAMLGRRSGPDE